MNVRIILCSTHCIGYAAFSKSVLHLFTGEVNWKSMLQWNYVFSQKVSEQWSSMGNCSEFSWEHLHFWDVLQHRLVVICRCFGTSYLSHLQGSKTAWPLEMGLIGCPVMPVTNYQCTPRNILEEWKCNLHLGGSLKSHTEFSCFKWSLKGSWTATFRTFSREVIRPVWWLTVPLSCGLIFIVLQFSVFCSDGGGSRFFQNVCAYQPNCVNLLSGML